MSVQQNQAILTWYDHLQFLENCYYTRDGRPLSRGDSATWSKALLLCAIVWQDLFSDITDSSVSQWIHSVVRFDVIEVVSVLKDADAILTRLWEDNEDVSWERFKTRLYARYTHAGPILGPIRAKLVSYLSSPILEVSDYRDLHQALAFVSRVNLRDYEDESAWDNYVQFDGSLQVSDWSLVARMNIVLREWLSDFRVTSLPSHGNGSVAEELKFKSLYDKYLWLGADPLLLYVLCRYQTHSLSELGPGKWWLNGLERTSRFKQVPKNALKRRNICMEPACLQYFQHMVQTDLYNYIEGRIPHRILFRDSSRNVRLAREGSVFGQLATIDLSSASDSVSWDLTRAAFRGTPLLPWLYATRSIRTVSGQGRDRRMLNSVRKFAPMGSALCFPVECLVFASVCEVAVREARMRSSYSVYGDDIVIESTLVSTVIDYLQRLGFTVNDDKSFYRQSPRVFRESCGGEFVDGQDVTPVRIPRKFAGEGLDPHHAEKVATYVKLANACFHRGLLGARRFLIFCLREALPRGFFPAFGTNEALLSGDWERNYIAPRVWNKNYQCVQVVGGQPIAYYPLDRALNQAFIERSPLYEEIRLFEWFRTAENKRLCERHSFLARRYFAGFSSLRDDALSTAIPLNPQLGIGGLIRLESRRLTDWG